MYTTALLEPLFSVRLLKTSLLLHSWWVCAHKRPTHAPELVASAYVRHWQTHNVVRTIKTSAECCKHTDATLHSARSGCCCKQAGGGKKKSHLLTEEHTKLHNREYQPSMRGVMLEQCKWVHSSGRDVVFPLRIKSTQPLQGLQRRF